MKRVRILLLLAVLCLTSFAAAQDNEISWSTSVEHVEGDVYSVTFRADIAPGWHMYDLQEYEGGPNPTVFTITPGPGLSLEGPLREIDKPARHYDELFGMEIGYYERRARFVQNVRLSAPKAILNANVEWMLCDDKSCLPPTDRDFTVEITATANAAKDNAAGVAKEASPPAARPERPVLAEEPSPDSAEAGGMDAVADTIGVAAADASGNAAFGNAVRNSRSIWSLILTAMAWAMLALVTPCVFPMIPMTVSYFLKSGGGRFRALTYGVFIVLLYTLPIASIILITRIIGGQAVTSDIFNWLSTHWLPNVVFFLVFMIFAVSFFGAFEITIPSRFVNRSDRNADRKGLTGVFFMALTLVLISFSCTGPIVGNALIESTMGSSFWTPVITMFAFSVTFALPFTLFAFFPSLLSKLPQSGGWLNSVKVVLGFIEVALGFKFLSIADQTYHWGLLDREIYLAIWIVVFSLMGFYLLGKIRFKNDSDIPYVGVGRLSLVIIIFSFVVYLIPGMFGAPLKALSGYLPPMHSQDFVLGTNHGSEARNDGLRLATAPRHSDFLHLPHGLQGFFDLDEAQQYADKVEKPLFIDITGHGCVNCREMEARVWSDPKVLGMLRDDYVVVAIYLDDKKILPESEWITTDNGKVLKGLGKINSYRVLKKYGVNAQPYYILQGREGKLLAPPRGYDLSVPGFVEFLESGLRAYEAQAR